MVPMLTVGLAIAACAPGAGGSAIADVPPAKVGTPLEARDALDSLDVFGKCFDPDILNDANFGVNATDGRGVFCAIVAPEDYETASGYRNRGIDVIFLRDDWPKVVADFCLLDVSDFKIVTDHETFFVYGTRDIQRGESDGMWPEEVWPEDVAGVLGGEVTTAADLCSKARSSE